MKKEEQKINSLEGKRRESSLDGKREQMSFSFPQREEKRGGEEERKAASRWRDEERRRNSQPCGPTGLDDKPPKTPRVFLSTSHDITPGGGGA